MSTVFWSSDLLDLTAAKAGMKSILKPGRKAKFVAEIPGGGTCKELCHKDLAYEQMEMLQVPPSCGGIKVAADSLFPPSEVPGELCVIGPYWDHVKQMPKSRELLLRSWYFSSRLGSIVDVMVFSEYGIGFMARPLASGGGVKFFCSSRPDSFYRDITGVHLEAGNEKVDPELVREMVVGWMDEFGLSGHPAIKETRISLENEPHYEVVLDGSSPRWAEERGQAFMKKVFQDDANPKYPVALYSMADYAAADCTFLKAENIREQLVPILQAAKDNPLPGKYSVNFYTILSPSWREREKRRKKLKGDATEAEKLGELVLENGIRAEAVLVISREGYGFTLFFEENPDDAIRFTDTALFQKLEWKLQN